MIKNKCLVCGSYNLKADRSLSGRLVCMSCGNPYGYRKITRNKFNFNKLNRMKFLFIFIIILFIFIII